MQTHCYGLTEFIQQLPAPLGELQDDSRNVQSGDIFIALNGATVDGRRFIPHAIQQGAAGIIQSGHRNELDTIQGLPRLTLPDLNGNVGEWASAFYHHPSHTLTMVGVTGTNGKTSVSHFIQQSLSYLNMPCGVMGTLGYGLNPPFRPSTHTTPSAVQLQRSFHEMQQAGAQAVAMEVSSHSLAQNRPRGTQFDAAVFTNLSREHLDYHATMNDYALAKQRLFRWPGLGDVIINADDPYAEVMTAEVNPSVNRWHYSRFHRTAPVHTQWASCHAHGIDLTLTTPTGTVNAQPQIVGSFNISNLLAVATYLVSAGFGAQAVSEALNSLTPVPGRMEAFIAPNHPLVIVDYAHTPEALELALQAASQHNQGRLMCVFGCGGERDRGKRPMMAAITERYCDAIWLTDDNPRSEPVSQIIDDTLAGARAKERFYIEHQRARAIHAAIEHGRAADTILVAGKGHENYQVYDTVIQNHSDRDCVKEALQCA